MPKCEYCEHLSMAMEFKTNQQSDLKDFLSRNTNVTMAKWETIAL